MRSNSRGTTQITFGSRTNQSSANGIFGQQNNTTASKNSVSDIKRMLARDSRSTQMQAENSLGQESIVTSTLSYSESLRNQRQQTKNTTLALKKLKYQFKNISSKILRSKTSQAAKQAAGQARREVLRLKRQKQSGNYDDDEIEAAINHAKAMERVAKKKAKHLEEEELAKAAGGIWQGEKSARTKKRELRRRIRIRTRKPKRNCPVRQRKHRAIWIWRNMIIRSWMNFCYRPVSLWWK